MGKANIRQSALAWFFDKNPSVIDPVITSKFYTSQENHGVIREFGFFRFLLTSSNRIK